MSTSSLVADRPNYVLLDQAHRLGPKVMPSCGGRECSAIYGFSDKVPYNEFCTNSPLELKPYPLVKGYLRNQVDAPSAGLRLVVLDAAGPSEPEVLAATIEAVLAAHENRVAHVAATHHLTFDRQANAYQVQEASVRL